MRATLAAFALILGACTAALPPPPATARAPAVVAEPEPLEPELATELLLMRDEDQEVRKRWLKDQKNPDILGEMDQLSRRHVLQLREILARHGWPGKSMVGTKAAGAAWMIAQHGGQQVLGEMLPLMYEAVKKRELEEGLYATSLDRVLVQRGRKQMYGTQFDTDPATGKCQPKPIEDAEHVDERRVRAGMGTLAEYTEQLCKLYMQKP